MGNVETLGALSTAWSSPNSGDARISNTHVAKKRLIISPITTFLELHAKPEFGDKRMQQVRWLEISRSERTHFTHHCMTVADIQKTHQRLHRQSRFPNTKWPRNPEAQQIDARQPHFSGWLQSHRLGVLPQFRAAKDVCRLNRVTRVMLKIDAGVDVPRQIVSAAQLENVGRIEVQVIVLSIDVQVGIVKIIRRNSVR